MCIQHIAEIADPRTVDIFRQFHRFCRSIDSQDKRRKPLPFPGIGKKRVFDFLKGKQDCVAIFKECLLLQFILNCDVILYFAGAEDGPAWPSAIDEGAGSSVDSASGSRVVAATTTGGTVGT